MSAPDDARVYSVDLSKDPMHSLAGHVARLERDLATLRERYEVLRDAYMDAIDEESETEVEAGLDAELARRREARP